MPSIDTLIEVLEGAGPLPSRELQRRIEASQATVSRLITRAGERVVRVGRGRSTRYAATREAFAAGRAIALHQVDRVGVIAEVATLHPLAGGRYFVVAARAQPWLLGDSGTGLFDSLPYFLYDLRPTGFIGRLIAAQLASEWGYPADPRRWSDEQIGTYLIRRGDDLPGNQLLGAAAAERVRTRSLTSVGDRCSAYPRLAQQVLRNEPAGSSAAGEQPKFAVYSEEAGHVLVKFAPPPHSETAARWQDLLTAEHHALAMLRGCGRPAVETALIDGGGRRFLESVRFDRHGEVGRSAALSLTVVDAEFVGFGHGWARVAAGLHQRGLFDKAALEHLAWCETFGQWIGNTDMHLGNVSVVPTEHGFTLLPLYDMLPMLFAPVRDELPERQLVAPVRRARREEVWEDSGRAAQRYWQQLAAADQLTEGFRELAGRCARVIARALT